MSDIWVQTATAEYPIRIGAGVRNEVKSYLPEKTQRVAVCVDATLFDDPRTQLDVARDSFRIAIAAGEDHKTLNDVETLCRKFAQEGMQRSDAVVTVGGGVASDVAGLAASLFNRGITVIHVPTTLLGQVDAAIGGKTAVNLPEGKNLVGAFHQPAAVLCDTDFLSSLPPREYTSGLGEVCKCELAINKPLKELPVDEMIRACVNWKAEIVSGDERESGNRALLNYGHTLAHALESSGAPFTHGEAVGIGLCFAARLARSLDRISHEREVQIEARVAEYGLPTKPGKVDIDELLDRMKRDKKRQAQGADDLTFVLDAPNGVEVVSGIAIDSVRQALKEWLA